MKTTRRLGTSIVASLCVLFAALGAPQPARAVPGDVISASVSEQSQYDDNLFRLPDNVTPQAQPGENSRSDWINTTQLGLKVDKHFSQQEITFDGTFSRSLYSNYSFLDYSAVNAAAMWKWALTDNFTGDLAYNRNQSLNSFADFTGFEQRNINTNVNERLDLDYRLRGEWHFALATYQFVQRNDQPVFELEDVRIDSVEPSFRYQSEAGNSLGLYLRSATGHYLDLTIDPAAQVDNQFHEREAGVRMVWQLDGKSGIYAAIGDLSREHTHFSDRNFEGPVGQFSYTYAITGKTTLVFSATRQLGSYQTETSSYLITNVYAIGPTWAATEKIALSARLQDIQLRFHGAIGGADPPRVDDIYALSLIATWRLFQDLSFVGSFSHSNRSSNFPELQFSDNTISLLAKFIF